MARTQHERLLFSIHGIRTRAAWQDALTKEVATRGWKHEPFNYGYFSIFSFLWGAARRRIVERFHDWYVQRVRPHDGLRRLTRPSIIAHSFGSYVVGESMLKYREIKFDKIILCGSILPTDFDWPELLARNQVWRVRNEFGLQDRWAKMVGRFVPRTGDSGFVGFAYDSPCIERYQFNYHEHGDYFRLGHCKEHWMPFLNQKSLQVNLRHGRDIPEESAYVATLNRTHGIDTECFKKLPGYDHVELPRGLSTTWIRVNPDIYTFLIDEPGDRVVGYVNAVPLREEAFRGILSGRLNDNEITADDLLPFDRGDPVWLYLMSVAIEAGARRIGQGIYQEGFERLMSGLEEKTIDYWVRFGTRVQEIGAVGWTSEGRQICEALGLVQRGVDRQGHPTYSIPVNEAVRRHGRLGGLVHRLKERYSKR